MAAVIDTIIFDLEGVVVDTEPIWGEADTEFVRRRGLKHNDLEFRHKVMGMNLHDGSEIFKNHYGFDGDKYELAEERRQIFKELIKKDPEFIPSFLEFFQQVKDKYKTAVATSLERDFISQIDKRLNILQMFKNHVYSIADIGYKSKPDPAIFLYSAEKLESKPSTCLVIEDAPNGVEAAKKAGMRCIALTTSTKGSRLTKADLIVDSYKRINTKNSFNRL